ncbi:uncharacterized protein [Rutidosis leptorrhynchoides]
MQVFKVFKKANLDSLTVADRPKTAAELEVDKIKDTEFEEQLKSPERPTEGGNDDAAQPSSSDVEIIEGTPKPSGVKKTGKRTKRVWKRAAEDAETTASGEKSDKAVDAEEDDDEEEDEETHEDNTFETPPFTNPLTSTRIGTTQSSSSSHPPSVVPLSGLRSFLENPVNKSDSFVNFLKGNTIADLSSSLTAMTLKQSCQSTAAALVLLNHLVLHGLKMQEAQATLVDNTVQNASKLKRMKIDLNDANLKWKTIVDLAKKKEETLQLIEKKCVAERLEKEKVMEEKSKLLKEVEELKKLLEQERCLVDEKTVTAAASEKKFIDLKLGIPDLVQRVLKYDLVGKTFHEYLMASVENDISDAVEEIVNFLPNKPDPLPTVISKHIKPDAEVKLQAAMSEVSLLKIVSVKEVCEKEDAYVKDILEVPI